MESTGKKVALVFIAFVVISSAFFSGIYIGLESIPHENRVTGVVNTSEGRPNSVDFAPFWKAWNIINEKFVPLGTTTPDVANDQKVWGAVAGLAASLNDPYTAFLPPIESELFEADINGNFEGVGMEIGIRDDILTVISPLENTPAKRAGIRSGDKILEIDEKTTLGLTIDEAVQLIRGERGSTVEFTLLRNNGQDPFKVSVTRGVIDIPSTDSYLRDDGVYVIRLFNFSAVAADEFRQALRGFILSGSDTLILDLRGNAGGFLQAAIDMASWFLPSGDVVVKEDFGQGKEPRVYRSKGYDIFGPDFSMVILVDGGTASASEILAGALSEHGVATLVGTQTFGKGSVQELIPITTDTNLKITIARWLTPKGVSISQNGLTPDIIVELPNGDLEFSDTQMEKAAELLTR